MIRRPRSSETRADRASLHGLTGTIMASVTVVLMIGACSAAGQEPTATSPAPGKSTSEPTMTTSTTEVATTTTAPTTTTLVATTTTTLLAGNWADRPVIASGIADMVLGWWDGSSWVDAEEGMALPIEGGEDYQVVLDGETGVIQGSAQVEGCDIVFPSDFPGIELSDPDALHMLVQEGGRERMISGVAISAGWELRPRPVSGGEAHPNLEAIAAEMLEERGFDIDTVALVQTVEADLDADGAIETLVVAEETELANSNSDVYSIVFAVSPSWEEPVLVSGSVIPPDEVGFPESYRVSAIADLSGDGRMEVVVDGQGWENGWVTVYELAGSELRERLGVGCGV